MAQLAGTVNVADREWLRDVSVAMLGWMGGFAGAGLLVEIVEQRAVVAALTGLPPRCLLVLPLVAALGAGTAVRGWAVDGRLVAVVSSGWSPARLALGAAFAGAALGALVLVGWELTPSTGPQRGAWVVLPGPQLQPDADGAAAQLWLRVDRLTEERASGIDAAWLRNGALVGAGRAASAAWDGKRWLVTGPDPTVSVGGVVERVPWVLPDPEIWSSAPIPGPLASISILYRSSAGVGRTAWLTARLADLALAAAAAALGAAAALRRTRAWAFVCFGAAFMAIVQTTLTLAVTQGRWGPAALWLGPAVAIGAAGLSLARVHRSP